MFILDSDQLEVGLRFFDIRIRHFHNELLIYHGPISQHNCLDNVVEELVQFLEIHPTEFVLFRLVNYVDDAEGNAALEDPKGRQGRVRPRCPNYFIFMQYSAKILQNNRLAHQLWEFPPSGKSWINVKTCCLKDNMFSSTCYKLKKIVLLLAESSVQ